jgi:hypothetical protein
MRRAAFHASGETIGGVFMGVISCAMLLSLHEAFDEDLTGRQARGPHTPDLSLIDPGIVLGRGGEADVCEDVEHRLAGSRRRLAVAPDNAIRWPSSVSMITCRSSSMRPSARTRR